MTRATCTLLSIVSLAALACGGSAGGGDCRPGEPIACACEDGRPGTATCGAERCDCPAAYALIAEPAALAFGEVPHGASRELVLVLRNPGLREVRLRSVELVGADSGLFSLPDRLPASIPAGGGAPLSVRFTASELGTAIAVLRVIPDDAGVGPVEVPITGRVSGARLSCSPSPVSLPEIWVGFSSTAEVVCTNAGAGIGEDSRLTLDRLEVQGEGFTAAWGIGTDRDPILDVGESASLEIRFTPTSPGEHRGTLTVSGDRGQQAIALDGNGIGPPAPVFVSPAELDFGEAAAGCESVDRAVEVINATSTPLHVATAELTEGVSEEFFVRSYPPAGTEIAPGASATFTVAYRPVDRGADLGALLVWLRERGEPFLVPLRGRGGGDVLVRDSFAQLAKPKLDVLLVIDNGTTMGPEAARLVPELGGLPEWLEEGYWDYRLAVTTTGLVAGGPGCPGGADGGEDGRLFPVDGSRPRILDENTPDLAAIWAANLAVGTCQSAAPQAFEAAVRALTPPLSTGADDPRHDEPNDGNLGFLRPEAFLDVVAIADRADGSPADDGVYFEALHSLKGPWNGHLIRFSAITGNRRSGCVSPDGGSATAGDRLIDMTGRFMAGDYVSICAEDWVRSLFPQAAPKTCFFLEHQPENLDANWEITEAAGEIRVRVNGVAVPSMADGEPVWRYSPDMLAVCFDPGHIPGPGAHIDVDYYVSGCLYQ